MAVARPSRSHRTNILHPRLPHLYRTIHPIPHAHASSCRIGFRDPRCRRGVRIQKHRLPGHPRLGPQHLSSLEKLYREGPQAGQTTGLRQRHIRFHSCFRRLARLVRLCHRFPDNDGPASE
ncbi:CDP-alcohol phosphatidyltransferase [Histoplasma ohiense]|nr:CDP-alcohol phosphatidyltransferase [Histoplasma ohiense (nom. inval.)]